MNNGSYEVLTRKCLVKILMYMREVSEENWSWDSETDSSKYYL